MCGIAGIYNLNKKAISKSQIKKMTDIIAHRGPDDEGFYVKENIGLGHRRLSIIDLTEAGHQPMANEDESLWIVYDGEVYNFLEIREELERLGHRFKSSTDTEVILHSYEEWGTGCLNRFNGAWAFAIWDGNKEELFCSRDRFGVKPLYYYFDGRTFAFASEIKALFSCFFVKKEPNENKIYDYLAINFLDYNEETFFKNIKQLEPSCYLVLKDNHLEIRRYYELLFNPELGKFDQGVCKKYSQKFIELLEDSVRLRLRSDVPIGSCLSGGLDSSTIVCLVNKLLKKEGASSKMMIGEKQKTFSSCFEDLKFDERKYIKEVIEITNADPHFAFPSGEGLWEEIDDLIWCQEEPFNSTRVYAQYNVMRLAKERGITVLLSGQGADELLAGYPEDFDAYLSQLFFGGRLKVFSEEFWEKNRMGQYPIKSFLYNIFLNPIYGHGLFSFLKPRFFLRNGKRQRLLNLINQALVNKYKEKEKEATEYRYRLNPNLQTELWLNEKFVLREFLRYEDRNSMAFSVEVRLPFVDYRLVEYVFSLPGVYKIHQGWTKYLLRMGAKNLLPEEIRCRKDKMGFVTPEIIWLRNGWERLKEIFKGRDFRAGEYINQKAVLSNPNNFFKPKNIGISELWRFINLELWLRRMF